MRWEYRVLTAGYNAPTLERALAGAGEDGWELVSAVAAADGVVLFLKRPVVS